MQLTELSLSNDRIDDRDRVAQYLHSCPILVMAAGMDLDPLSPGGTPAVPIGVASDGTFAWPLSVAYFTDVHGIAPHAELLAHIRAHGYAPPALSSGQVEALRDALAAAAQTPETSPAASGDEQPDDRFPFPLDEVELRRLKATSEKRVEKSLTKEYRPGHRSIDRAREKRNPKYFAGTFASLEEFAVWSWALGDMDAARVALDLMPEMLAEALSFDWTPDADEAQAAIAFAAITGRRALIADLVAADRGLAPSGGGGPLDNSISWWNRCVGDLVTGGDESVRSRLEDATDSVDALAFKSDRDLVTLRIAMFRAIIDADPVALDRAARRQTDRLLTIIASQVKPEQSDEFIDSPTTALLAIARRRGMAIPEDLPICPVALVAEKWVD